MIPESPLNVFPRLQQPDIRPLDLTLRWSLQVRILFFFCFMKNKRKKRKSKLFLSSLGKKMLNQSSKITMRLCNKFNKWFQQGFESDSLSSGQSAGGGCRLENVQPYKFDLFWSFSSLPGETRPQWMSVNLTLLKWPWQWWKISPGKCFNEDFREQENRIISKHW